MISYKDFADRFGKCTKEWLQECLPTGHFEKNSVIFTVFSGFETSARVPCIGCQHGVTFVTKQENTVSHCFVKK